MPGCHGMRKENLSVRLPSSSSASCDGPITLDEVRKALEGAAIGRSPGSDGLSAEFYLAFGRSWVRILSRFLTHFSPLVTSRPPCGGP